MIFVEIRLESAPDIDTTLLEKAAQTALTHQNAPQPADLSIVLGDDAQIHALNLEFLGIDAPTDVLSFPANETDPETGDIYLGDIIISLPRAILQAAAAEHNVVAELQLLVVHGVLHLLGHDHAEVDEKTRMWQAQSEILHSLGLGDIKIRED